MAYETSELYTQKNTGVLYSQHRLLEEKKKEKNKERKKKGGKKSRSFEPMYKPTTHTYARGTMPYGGITGEIMMCT